MYHRVNLSLKLASLHMVQAILGKLGIGSRFTIYVMLAVTNSKHKLRVVDENGLYMYVPLGFRVTDHCTETNNSAE
jgi:hypothetical protein